MNDDKNYKIMFVCHGNICRSPMAEFVFKDIVKNSSKENCFTVRSCATSDEETGNPVYPPARRELQRHGIACEGHAARQMTRADYAHYDLFLGMDDGNLRDMRRICGGDPAGKLLRLLDLTDRPGSVADPWYTGDFAATWRDVSEGCEALLKTLTEK